MAAWRDRLTGRRIERTAVMRMHAYRHDAAFAAALFAALACASDATAQGAGPYYDDDSVLVDLSVIDDGGIGRRPAFLPPAGVVPGIGGALQMPGTEMPRSRFHGVAPPSGQAAAPARTPSAAAKSRPQAAPKTAAQPPARRAPTEKVAALPAQPPAAQPPRDPTRPPPPPVIAAMPAPSPSPPLAPQAAPLSQPPAPPPVAAVPPPAPRAAATTIPSPAASIPVPPPAPAARPAPAEPPSQAALPLPPAAPPAARALQIAFAAGDSRLPAAAQGGLKELAERMKTQESLRLQIVAYAAGDDLSASAARRLSLSRALAVRTFLIDAGVRGTRIDVRALGDKVSDQPANRVDLSFSDR